MAANGPTDDEGSQIQFVASKTERLTFCWPISDWSERTEPAKTRSYHFMEDNPVSKITGGWSSHPATTSTAVMWSVLPSSSTTPGPARPGTTK